MGHPIKNDNNTLTYEHLYLSPKTAVLCLAKPKKTQSVDIVLHELCSQLSLICVLNSAGCCLNLFMSCSIL